MIEINGEKKLHFHIFIPNLQRGCHHLFSVFGSNFHMNLTHMVLDGQIFTQKSLPKIPSYRSKIYGRYSAFANAIYVWDNLQICHHNVMFHQLRKNKLNEI